MGLMAYHQRFKCSITEQILRSCFRKYFTKYPKMDTNEMHLTTPFIGT